MASKLVSIMSTPSRQPQPPAVSRGTHASGHGAKSQAVRERAVVALLSSPTIRKAARQAGVHERTLRQWLATDEAFNAVYASARRAAFQNAMDRVQVATATAVETLEDLLRSKQPSAVRLGAARTLIELGLHRHDSEAIMRKLQELEAAQRRATSTSIRRRRS